MAEPSYSDWIPVVDANNRRHLRYCPYCERRVALMLGRYYTNRDGEKERQFRVECPVCGNTGKVYLHESIAEMSWEAREHDPLPPLPRRRRDV